jgi:ankyrin repeat protein
MTALLIRAGASVTNPNKWGFTAVHFAASQDNTEIAQLVIEHSETVELFDQDAKTPLFFACAKGKPAIVQLLLDKGASPHVCALDGSTPLHWAMLQSSTESTEQEEELKEVVRILLDKKVDVLARDSDGMTALHWAARYNCIAGAEVLLEKNISINIDATPCGIKPLHLAAFKGNLEFVRFLVKRAADVNALDAKRFTPLHYVALQKKITEMHLKTAILLISCGCDYKRADNSAQRTAYELAQHDSIRELLRDPQAYIMQYQNILNT